MKVVKKTHFMFNNLFCKRCHWWNNVEEYCGQDRTQMRIWCIHIVCWVTKAIRTHAAFPLQQWLHKHLSVLCYMYRISRPIRRTTIFSLEILEPKKKKRRMYFNFSNFLEENRIVIYQS